MKNCTLSGTTEKMIFPIVEDIAIYGHELLLTTKGGEDRLEMYKQFIGMFKPRGVVDIAFKTDEGLIIIPE